MTSVVAMGRAEFINDETVRDEKLRKLARRYCPSEEEIEGTIQAAASRVQMIALNIEHMTGKLVHEK